MAAKSLNVEVDEAEKFHKLFIQRLKDIHAEESEDVQFTWRYEKQNKIL